MSLDNYTIKDIEHTVTGIKGKIVKADISRLTAAGENYISLVFKVDLQVEDEEGRKKILHAVAKRLPLVKMMFDFNAIAMKNEITWYSQVLPLLSEFAEAHGIAADYYPKHLGSRLSLDPEKTEADSESVLLVESLIPQGYVNENRLIGFDYQTAKVILKKLAHFHAIPLIMKFKRPEQFKVLQNLLRIEKPFPGPPDGKIGQDGASPNHPPEDLEPPDSLMLEKILELPACQPYRENIRKVKENMVPMHERFVGDGKEPWATITHGDFWANNIMIKSGKEGGSPLVKILDFQICQYSSYARDVVFFLLTSLRDDVQRQHLDELLRFYYEEFTGLLEKLDVQELKLTYEDYLEEVKRVATVYEVSHSLFFCNPIFASKGNQPDHLTGEINMFDHMKNMINSLNDRQKEKAALVVELCVERGWM